MIINANSIHIPLADQTVHCVVTSPPYWGLRDYGLKPTAWPEVTYSPLAGAPPLTVPGCDPKCKHIWGEEQIVHQRGKVGDFSSLEGGLQAGGEGRIQDASQGSWCQRCGGWRGCLGLEPTPEMFVAHIVAIFREVWRVLRDDGTLWLNLGDTYAGGGRGGNGDNITGRSKNASQCSHYTGAVSAKNLIGIPWRVAFALQADGWWLRLDGVWAKGRDGSVGDEGYGSAMPGSQKDRPTHTHEYVFLLSKSKRYYYDKEAVKVRHSEGSHELRSVWLINPKGYSGAHFATFPPDLVSIPIRAGTSQRGVCPICGAPWERTVVKSAPTPRADNPNPALPYTARSGHNHGTGKTTLHKQRGTTTVDWRPTCDHGAEPVPATVLDLFFGSGTTGEVCQELGRWFVGLDLNARYLRDLALPRAEKKQTAESLMEMPLFSEAL